MRGKSPHEFETPDLQNWINHSTILLRTFPENDVQFSQ